MAIIEQARQNVEAIRQIGERAREEARRTGTSISYWDKSIGAIVREYPDGRLVRVKAIPREDHEPVGPDAFR
jgi:hypothetical protein